MSQDSGERHIPFESCYNFRDVGGYPTRDGRIVRWGRLYRSADLCFMTEQDAAHARSTLGIRTVIDLRSSYEAKNFGCGPLPGAGVKYHNIRLTQEYTGGRTGESSGGPVPPLLEVYLDWVKSAYFWERLAEVLAILTEPDGLPAVFHCLGGKDRTGLMAAVIQGCLGVTGEDIAADYGLTEQATIPEAIAELRKARYQSDSMMAKYIAQLPTDWYHAYPETMATVLAAMLEDHRSIRECAVANGVNPTVLQKLENELLM